jgi:hypothetical protein
MSETSEKARADAKAKVQRLTSTDPRTPVDASGYSPDGPMHAGAKTGMRPISRRQFKRGGKVEGEAAMHRADRKPRKSGGSALTADSYINRDVKEANKERGGDQFDGGMKKGGRIHKLIGGGLTPQQRMAVAPRAAAPPAMSPGMRPMMRKDGGKVHKDEAQDKKLIHAMGCKCEKCHGGRVGKKAGGATGAQAVINGGTRPVGGRLARKGGGRTKGKTNVNIIITQPGGAAGAPPMPMPPPGAGAPPGGLGLRQAPPPPPMMPPQAPPGAAPPVLQRKSGGRALEDGKLVKPGRYPIDSGAGGGLGRMEKAKAYGA